jgi:mannose-1-phosphate guanylyltransferase/mannose-6-phosphate isomerase
MSKPDRPVVPVLMSGGAGTRLWPLSRRDAPKQFHRLGAEHTLIQDTALRFAGEGFAPPVVLCAAEHAGLVREQLAQVGVGPALILAEPGPRNTGPAAVAAAASALDPDAILLLVHADNLVSDVAAARRLVATARPHADAGAIVLFGLKPTHAETSYGYIRAGAGEGPVRPVAQFVEKPPLDLARRFAADPDYSWNGGMFLFRAAAFLEEARSLEPHLTAVVERAVAEGAREGDVLRLSPRFLEAPAIAVDHAILERTGKARVIAADMGWRDVGNWRSVWEGAPKGEGETSTSGDVVSVDAARVLARTDGPTVVLSGVSDLAVVVERGVVLVVRLDDPAAAGAAVRRLIELGREELL